MENPSKYYVETKMDAWEGILLGWVANQMKNYDVMLISKIRIQPNRIECKSDDYYNFVLGHWMIMTKCENGHINALKNCSLIDKISNKLVLK